MNVPATPKHYLVAHVRDALALDPEMHEIGIEVRVVGDQIFLHGTVATEERRVRISRALEAQFPEIEIHNQVEVQEQQPPRTEEKLT
jgi:hypothetical protein